MDRKTRNPKLIGGMGEINFGKQYRQGNRVYDSNHVAMALMAQPIGNLGGYSYLYLKDVLIDEVSEKYYITNERAQALIRDLVMNDKIQPTEEVIKKIRC